MRRHCVWGAVIVLFVCGAVQGAKKEKPLKKLVEVKDCIIYPSEQVVMSVAIDGRLAETPIEEGQFVKKGQVLAKIEDRLYELGMKRAEISWKDPTPLKEAELKLAQSETEYKRFKKLKEDQGAVSTFEVERARLSYEISKVALQNVREGLKKLRLDYEQAKKLFNDTRTLSPFDGIVEKRVRSAGETVRKSDPVCQIIAVDPLHIEVVLSVDVVRKVGIGQKATVIVNGFEDRPVGNAEVFFVNPRVDAGSDTFTIKVKMKNPRNKDEFIFKPGMRADVVLYEKVNHP